MMETTGTWQDPRHMLLHWMSMAGAMRIADECVVKESAKDHPIEPARSKPVEVMGCPTCLKPWDDGYYKQRWQIVRLDTFELVRGDIVSADEESGEAVLAIDGQAVTRQFGTGGIRIVARQTP